MDNNNNKGKKLLERDGFYLVLFLCVCLIALTAVWVTKNSIDNLATENGFANYQNGGSAESKVANNDDEIHLIKDNPKTVPTSSKSNQNLSSAKALLNKAQEVDKKNEVTNKKSEAKALMPVDGVIAKEYSENEASYSTTLEQWELHKAIDIKTKEGTPVKAAMSGEVSEITNDKNGVSIKLKHADNLVTVYSNLSNDTLVKKGQQVNAGDTISTVGNTSVVENKEDSHLHFEAFKNEKNIDPLSIMK